MPPKPRSKAQTPPPTPDPAPTEGRVFPLTHDSARVKTGMSFSDVAMMSKRSSESTTAAQAVGSVQPSEAHEVPRSLRRPAAPSSSSQSPPPASPESFPERPASPTPTSTALRPADAPVMDAGITVELSSAVQYDEEAAAAVVFGCPQSGMSKTVSDLRRCMDDAESLRRTIKDLELDIRQRDGRIAELSATAGRDVARLPRGGHHAAQQPSTYANPTMHVGHPSADAGYAASTGPYQMPPQQHPPQRRPHHSHHSHHSHQTHHSHHSHQSHQSHHSHQHQAHQPHQAHQSHQAHQAHQSPQPHQAHQPHQSINQAMFPSFTGPQFGGPYYHPQHQQHHPGPHHQSSRYERPYSRGGGLS